MNMNRRKGRKTVQKAADDGYPEKNKQAGSIKPGTRQQPQLTAIDIKMMSMDAEGAVLYSKNLNACFEMEKIARLTEESRKKADHEFHEEKRRKYSRKEK
jgi:hypothetical protein